MIWHKQLMEEEYLPQSDFLHAIMNEEVSFESGEFGERNLQQLILMTRDQNPVNRDWATLLLSQLELDRTDVREALLAATLDTEPAVRGEAILGLTQLEPKLALPILQRELEGEVINMPMLEAAIIIADPSLIPLLEDFSERSDFEWLDQMVLDAISACRAVT